MFAFSGYVAAIECRRVQVERPSCSTSGGQSEGIVLGEEVAGAARGVVGVVLVVLVLEGELELSTLACLVRLRQAATEVQVRQLKRNPLAFAGVDLIHVLGYVRLAIFVEDNAFGQRGLGVAVGLFARGACGGLVE